MTIAAPLTSISGWENSMNQQIKTIRHSQKEFLFDVLDGSTDMPIRNTWSIKKTQMKQERLGFLDNSISHGNPLIVILLEAMMIFFLEYWGH